MQHQDDINSTIKPIGVILANLGTPAAPTAFSVAKYLREFLSDPRVITLPAFLRWILLYLFILPFRSAKAAKAYKKIWSENGSPLLVNSKQFSAKLAEKLGDDYQVELAMRYGFPSIERAVKNLLAANCSKIIFLPLFPQYARSTTGSAVAHFLKISSKQPDQIPLEVKPAFFANSNYIAALAAVIADSTKDSAAEYLLFSYHGLPELSYNLDYRSQCYHTAQLAAAKLGLSADQYGVSFQSRFGASAWLKPYTDEFLQSLRQRGITNLALVCPSFITDCLETLEEVNIGLRKQWQRLGGQSFQLIPCLNSDQRWVEAVARILREPTS